MSEALAIASATPRQWAIRAALSASVLLTLAVLAATWIVLGRGNATSALYTYIDLYKHALSIIALLLAATTFAIAWFARLDRANTLAAAFASMLALSFAWILCDFTSASEALMNSEDARRALPWIAAAMALINMATPVLFLLFTEVFPAPLPGAVRIRAVLPQLWQGRASAANATSDSGWGRPLLVLLWLMACTAYAIGPLYGLASPLSLVMKAMIVICVTVAMAFVTARLMRRIDQRSEPTAIERWVVTASNASGVSGLGALTLLACIAIALALSLDLNVRAYFDDDFVEAMSYLILLAFAVLLVCVRPIRAEAPAVFWVGWILLAVGTMPQVVGLGDPLLVPGAYALIALAYWTVVCLFGGCANLIVSHARGDKKARARIQWILTGGVLALVSIVVLVLVTLDLRIRCDERFAETCAGSIATFIVLPLAPPTFMTLGMLLAIFASGALDSALALRRTAVFTIVLLILGALFGMIEGRLEHLLQDVAPGTAKPIAIAASLMVFHPTKHYCEIGVKKTLAWIFRLSEPA